MGDEKETTQFFDALFRKKRKNGEWKVVEAPDLGTYVADTHAHIHMLPDPAFALARCVMHGVNFVELITDPSEDGTVVFDNYNEWSVAGMMNVRYLDPNANDLSVSRLPLMKIAVGVHPHNASKYDAAMEAQLIELLHDDRVSALGEIGLDYHYDFSPRDVQQEVFRKQIRIAKEAGLPVILHLREAHDDGYRILQEEGFPQAGTLLHCYNLDAEELKRWVETDCYIAFGGPLTFKKAEEVREAAATVPLNRLLTETDSPYMTPEPLRGQTCGPDYVIFTAEKLCEVRGCEAQAQREGLLSVVYQNAIDLLGREPTEWQASCSMRHSEEPEATKNPNRA